MSWGDGGRKAWLVEEGAQEQNQAFIHKRGRGLALSKQPLRCLGMNERIPHIHTHISWEWAMTLQNCTQWIEVRYKWGDTLWELGARRETVHKSGHLLLSTLKYPLKTWEKGSRRFQPLALNPRSLSKLFLYGGGGGESSDGEYVYVLFTSI